MSTESDRLLAAQWVLERNLGWIAAAETKVGVVVAIDTAMLGALGAAFSSAETAVRTQHWAFLFTLASAMLLGAGLTCAAMAVIPRVTGPRKSLLFFGPIATSTAGDYFNSFKSASYDELLEDWTSQIHRNAQIAGDKFKWVRLAMLGSFIAILPWFSAIVSLLHKQ